MSDKLFVLQENAIGLREHAIAQLVAQRATDPAVKEIAARFSTAHGQGVTMLRQIASELGVDIPEQESTLDRAQIDALAAMPPADLEAWWLLHQRAMHAWDIVTFSDYAGRSPNARLDGYVRAVIEPLRRHSAEIDRLTAGRGLIPDRR